MESAVDQRFAPGAPDAARSRSGSAISTLTKPSATSLAGRSSCSSRIDYGLGPASAGGLPSGRQSPRPAASAATERPPRTGPATRPHTGPAPPGRRCGRPARRGSITAWARPAPAACRPAASPPGLPLRPPRKGLLEPGARNSATYWPCTASVGDAAGLGLDAGPQARPALRRVQPVHGGLAVEQRPDQRQGVFQHRLHGHAATGAADQCAVPTNLLFVAAKK